LPHFCRGDWRAFSAPNPALTQAKFAPTSFVFARRTLDKRKRVLRGLRAKIRENMRKIE